MRLMSTTSPPLAEIDGSAARRSRCRVFRHGRIVATRVSGLWLTPVGKTDFANVSSPAISTGGRTLDTVRLGRSWGVIDTPACSKVTHALGAQHRNVAPTAVDSDRATRMEAASGGRVRGSGTSPGSPLGTRPEKSCVGIASISARV